MKIPTVKAYAAKLLTVCLALIAAYLLLTIAYICISEDPLRHFTALDMLHNALLAIVLATGGGLLLDCEIRLSERK